MQCSRHQHTADAGSPELPRVVVTGDVGSGVQPGVCAGLSTSLENTPGRKWCDRGLSSRGQGKGSREAGCGPEGLAHALVPVLWLSGSLSLRRFLTYTLCKGQ